MAESKPKGDANIVLVFALVLLVVGMGLEDELGVALTIGAIVLFVIALIMSLRGGGSRGPTTP